MPLEDKHSRHRNNLKIAMDFIWTRSKDDGPLSFYENRISAGNYALGRQCSGNSEQGGNAVIVGTLAGPLRAAAETASPPDIKILAQAAQDSNGNFVVLIPHGDQIHVVTDAGGSIPVFWGSGPKGPAVGSRVQEVALATGLTTIDEVSVVDFLINGTICYPYSWYEGIRMVSPGAVCRFDGQIDGPTVDVHTYWAPVEPERGGEGDAREWADALYREVKDAVAIGLQGKKQGRIFFSGGEDSRIVLSLIPPEFPCTPTIVLDSPNRQLQIARRVTQSMGRSVEMIKRPEGYYRRDILARIQTIGPGKDIRHTHIFGPVTHPFRDADVLFGGNSADTLFKTHRMTNIATSRLGRDRPTSDQPDVWAGLEQAVDPAWFCEELTATVHERRLAHHRCLLELRPRTAGNWHWKWPTGPRPAYGHVLACLRIGPQVVEPFQFSRAYQLAAQMPDIYRVDRKAVRLAFHKSLGKSAWIPTSSGNIPALGGWPGVLARDGILIWRGLVDLFKRRPRIGQRDWGTDHAYGFARSKVEGLSQSDFQAVDARLEKILQPGQLENFWRDGNVPNRVRNRALALAFDAVALSGRNETAGACTNTAYTNTT